jgi:hypothetical protein
MSVAVGCSSDDDSGGTTGPSAGSAPATPTERPTTTAPATTTTTTTTTSTTQADVTTTIAEPIATVPEQGVPGIDSDDPFCRGWSEFAGSFQALTFASFAGSDPFAGARLEVIAAAAVTAAAQTLDDGFPDSITDERNVFVDEVIGPFARRAGRAVDALRSEGLTAGDLDVLGDAWLLTLVEGGVDDPELVVAVPTDLAGAVDAATVAFSANVPPISADPSLITEANAPATLRYLAERCPDQGTLAGNDAIG